MVVSTSQESLIPAGWEKKRRQSFVIFCFITFVAGIEWGIILPTLYHYLNNVIKAEQSSIWFGFTHAGYWTMSIIGSLTLTKYSDSTRNIRRSVIFICIIAVLGNFIYAIPYSPIFPLIGRSLQGIGDSLISVLNGEIIRVFPDKIVMKRISSLIATLYVALFISPCFLIMFKEVNVTIFNIPLGPLNSPNVFIGCLWLICLILTFVFIVDLSKIYDLKMEQSKSSDKYQIVKNEGNTHFGSDEKDTDARIPTRTLFRSEVFCFILFLSSICSYTETSNYGMTLPLVAEKYYQLSTNYTAIIVAATSLAFASIAYLMAKNSNYRSEIYFIIIGLCSFVISFQFLTLSITFHRVRTIGIVCLSCFSITQGIGWSVSKILLTTILSQLIPSSTQGFAEGIRRSTESIPRILAAFVGSFIHPFIIEHDFVLALLIFSCIGYLLVKRKNYCNIEVMKKDERDQATGNDFK